MNPKDRLPEGYVPFPTQFLQSGFPLKLSIYIYFRSAKRHELQLFRIKGEEISLDELVGLRQRPHTRVLALKKELDETMEFYQESPLYSTPVAKANKS